MSFNGEMPYRPSSILRRKFGLLTGTAIKEKVLLKDSEEDSASLWAYHCSSRHY